MSVSLATVRMRSRHAQNQRVMTIKQEEQLRRKDAILLSMTETIKDFICVIQKSFQSLLKKGSSVSSDVDVENDQVCEEKVMTNNTPTITAYNTDGCIIRKRIVSAPIPIPTRDKDGNKYPVYQRKKLEYI